MTQELTAANVESLIGQTIKWAAPGYNRGYKGIAKITSVNLNDHKPIQCEVIEGDELFYAHVGEYGNRPLCYTDDFREIEFSIMESQNNNVTKKYKYWLTWLNGNEEQIGSPEYGTEDDFNIWWESLHSSTKQMCTLHKEEI